MALIKCSECKKEISDKASACPHCGNPLKDKNAHLIQMDKAPQERRKDRIRYIMFLSTFIVGLVVSGYIFLFLTSPRDGITAPLIISGIATTVGAIGTLYYGITEWINRP